MALEGGNQRLCPGAGLPHRVRGHQPNAPPADLNFPAAPRPGSYDAGNPWVKGGPRYAPASSRTSGSSPAHASLGVVPRRPTAPSVPGRGQSYGYEEAPDGTLVLQVGAAGGGGDAPHIAVCC